MSEESTPSGGGIHIAGSVTGNVQSGSHARADYRQYGSATTDPAGAPQEAERLLEAVNALREQLRLLQTTSPGEVPPMAAQVVEAVLDDVQEAVPQSGAPEPGRIQRAVFTVTGALAPVAGLAAAVNRLREAAAPWF